MSYTHPDKIITSPLEAIKEMCLDCCGGSRSYVTSCPDTKCSLHAFRLGKNPYRKTREYTEIEKEDLRNRMKTAREAKETKNH